MKINGGLLSNKTEGILREDKETAGICKELIIKKLEDDDEDSELNCLKNFLDSNGLTAEITSKEIKLTNFPSAPHIFCRKRIAITKDGEKIGELSTITNFKFDKQENGEYKITMSTKQAKLA